MRIVVIISFGRYFIVIPLLPRIFENEGFMWTDQSNGFAFSYICKPNLRVCEQRSGMSLCSKRISILRPGDSICGHG